MSTTPDADAPATAAAVSASGSLDVTLPSILLQAMLQFLPPCEVVLQCARLSHRWHSAAAQPFSSRVLPPDDDTAQFMSTRSTDQWPWCGNRSSQLSGIAARLNAIMQSPLSHHVRIWPAIPRSFATVQRLTQLRHIHTLHLTGVSAATNLFQTRPFPLVSLHSLSLTTLDEALILSMPVLHHLRRLALVDRITTPSYPAALALVRLHYQTLEGVDLSRVKAHLKRNGEFLEAHLEEEEHTILTTWGCDEEARKQMEKWQRGANVPGAALGEGHPLPVRYTFDSMHPDDATTDEWIELSRRVPHLRCLLLPAQLEAKFADTTGIISFVRRLERLVHVEGACLHHRPTLEQLVADPAPPTLRAVHHGSVLVDGLLDELVKLPALSKVVERFTNLTTLVPLLRVAGTLREMAISGQQLYPTLAADAQRVFPELRALESLEVQRLQCGGADRPVLEESYLQLLRAIRTLPALKKLVLHTLPLLEIHLRALLAAEETDPLDGSPPTAASSTTRSASCESASSSSSSSNSLSRVFGLRELHLLDVNAFLYRAQSSHLTINYLTLPSMEPFFLPEVGEGRRSLQLDGAYFALLLDEQKLSRQCRVQLLNVFPLSKDHDWKARARAHFTTSSVIE